MKGIAIFKDEKSNKRILQVDIKEVAKHPSQFEDLMDTLIAEARRDEKEIGWDSVKKQLRKKGKPLFCPTKSFCAFFSAKLLVAEIRKCRPSKDDWQYVGICGFISGIVGQFLRIYTKNIVIFGDETLCKTGGFKIFF